MPSPKPWPRYPYLQHRSEHTTLFQLAYTYQLSLKLSRQLRFRCHRNELRGRGSTTGRSRVQAGELSSGNPTFGTPRHFAALHELFKHLSISESVHSSPEALVSVSDELIRADKAIERLEHQFLTVIYVIEDFSTKDEVSAINPNIGLLACAEPLHRTLVIEFSKMEIERRTNCNK